MISIGTHADSPVVYFTTEVLWPDEGISKKVRAQAKALARRFGSCALVSAGQQGGSETVVFSNEATEQMSWNCGPMEVLGSILNQRRTRLLYVRHPRIPSLRLVRLLRLAHRSSSAVLYEIPTYPFFYEQFRSSHQKIRAVAKILLNAVLLPFAYLQSDRFITIISNTGAHRFRKMLAVPNGIDVAKIALADSINRPKNVFRMMTIGTLYPYHGYDRLLEGLANCEEQMFGLPVEFHVVGESATITGMKVMSAQLGLKRVKFHGKLSSGQIDVLAADMHVGLGCLALHRRHANVDTSLKVVEYLCRGLPVVSSGTLTIDTPDGLVLQVSRDDAPIRVSEIGEWYRSLNMQDVESLTRRCRDTLDWYQIMCTIVRDVDCPSRERSS